MSDVFYMVRSGLDLVSAVRRLDGLDERAIQKIYNLDKMS